MKKVVIICSGIDRGITISHIASHSQSLLVVSSSKSIQEIIEDSNSLKIKDYRVKTYHELTISPKYGRELRRERRLIQRKKK